jgi:type VI secretion system Hcp family effector
VAQKNGFMRLHAKNQGVVNVGCSKKGVNRLGWTEFASFSFNSKVASSSGGGTGAGKSKHTPIVISREVDAASPLLLSALQSNPAFSVVEIDVLDNGTTGHGRVVSKFKLSNAQFLGGHRSSVRGKWRDVIAFSYAEISVVNGTIPADNWT